MHPEARKVLRDRFKIVVLDYAKHIGVTSDFYARWANDELHEFIPE